MNRIFAVLLTLLVTSSVLETNGTGKRVALEIDTKASKVYWTGKKVSGEHTGFVSIDNGTIYVNAGQVVGAEVYIDLRTIDCTDLTGEWRDKLVGHLKSDDFFSTDKHPVSKFIITSITGNGEEQKVVGDLTIKGITHEISFPAKITLNEGIVKANGTVSIDRTKWNIKYGSGKFFKGLGDRMIKDEFIIKFELKTKAGE